ncbi:MAG: ribosome maturation factor RimP [Campylobacteraceae bacterium]|jgi:ribosome maturation factor RimP|nr:ribosome maturation factor RimP [Campylobacteraceae bacterium]
MTLEESIQIAVEGCGVVLYDIAQLKEHNDNIYRVYIASKDGITLEKCTEVSRMISPILDLDEPMHGKYRLEVSSPGVERRLKKPAHFIGSIGSSVRIKDIATDKIEGVLKDADETSIVITTENGDETLPYDEILAAATYINW